MPDAYQAVDEMLSELADKPNVKIVLVARSVDIDRDPRLSGLVSNRNRVERFRVGDLDDSSVANILTANEVDVTLLDTATRQLLRVPIHLSVFSRLSLPSQTASYRTLQELYTRYTEEQRITIEDRLKSDTWNKVTSSLISWMSENEALTAPIGTLDDYAQKDIGVLESAGVLIRVGSDRVTFFHETYFDFLFARGFVSSGRDLHQFLASSGQHLFRRAQARQVLEYLSETDRSQFRNIAVRLLTSLEIRPHLIDVLISVLRQMQATKEDWQAIDPLAWTQGRVASKIRGLLSIAAWFDAADHDGRWERWLSTPSRRDAVFPEFLLAARLKPQRVEELVRPYLGSSSGWDRILVGLIEWSLSPGLINLAIDLVERGILDESRGPASSNRDFWSLLYTISDENPAGASQLIGAYLRRHLIRSKSDGSGDPFASGHLDSNSQTAGKVLESASSGAPAEFTKETLGFVIDVAAAGMGRGRGIYAAGGRWTFRHKGSYGVDSGIFTAIDSAIQRLPAADQAAAELTINGLTSIVNPAREIRFLTCRLYSALGLPDESIHWLLSNEENLQLGFADNLRWTSRELVKSATLECTQETLNRLTSALLNYYPTWERRPDNRRIWGLAQYELLSAVAESRLDDSARRRISELKRKFPELSVREPSPIVVGFLTSPIPESSARCMTDDHWRRAMAKYSQTEGPHWGLKGGASELAQVLGSCAKQEPERFASLALSLDSGVATVYLEAIIRQAGPNLTRARWGELCLHAYRVTAAGAAMAICRTVEEAPALTSTPVITVLEQCAADLHPKEAECPDDVSDLSVDILTAGMNSRRGQAGLAVAALLFHSADYVTQLTPIVEKLADDPSASVRSCAAESVRALMNHDIERALIVAHRLISGADVSIHSSPTTHRLLLACLLRAPARFADEVGRGLRAPDEASAKNAGALWAVAVLRELPVDTLPSSIQGLPSSAREGAAEVFAAQPDRSHDSLVQLFNDSHAPARHYAASSMRLVSSIDPDLAESLISSFTASDAFGEDFEQLLIGLDNHPGPLPGAAIDACEKIVTDFDLSLEGIRTHARAVGHYMVPLILRLYRQGDTPNRIRCLDIIDRLVEANSYGLEALEAER
ncbi:hypothetical protein [Streptomyces yangpuensis]|uniref:hypothetical protein n=1 Tax=Streptomyces yangpuensis TaxID=1648182 RepID=UPI00365BB7C7